MTTYDTSRPEALDEQQKAAQRFRLTIREQIIAVLIADGCSNKKIALRLGISPKTVDAHRSNIMQKLNIHKATLLVRWCCRVGLDNPVMLHREMRYFKVLTDDIKIPETRMTQ